MCKTHSSFSGSAHILRLTDGLRRSTYTTLQSYSSCPGIAQMKCGHPTVGLFFAQCLYDQSQQSTYNTINNTSVLRFFAQCRLDWWTYCPPFNLLRTRLAQCRLFQLPKLCISSMFVWSVQKMQAPLCNSPPMPYSCCKIEGGSWWASSNFHKHVDALFVQPISQFGFYSILQTAHIPRTLQECIT